jgi:hypothetical protein
VSTSARPLRRSPFVAHFARLAWALPISAAAVAACGGIVVFDEEGDATRNDGAGGAAPLTCDLVAGPIDLVPVEDNPAGCRGAVSCEVWFGHGQHLSCPRWSETDPPFVECDVRDCLCTIHEEERFVANFATGEVIDTRDPNMTCRYTLEPAE